MSGLTTRQMSKIFQLILILAALPAAADEFDTTNVAPLFESSCIGCHDASTDTPLNLVALTPDLSDASTFRTWQKIYDRVHLGEMPPASETPPNEASKRAALSRLKKELDKVNRAAQQSKSTRRVLRRHSRGRDGVGRERGVARSVQASC